MSQPSNSTDLPEGFKGIARLFPLPNVVLFPHVVQALHIFEQRYRQMVEDALAGDLLIAMACLEPGWESDYEGNPAIGPMTCLGKIVAHARLDDGRYNILLRGLRRTLVVRELESGEFLFRLAEVAVVNDVYSAEGASYRSAMQRDLLSALQRLAPTSLAAQEQLVQQFAQPGSLGILTDMISHSLPLDLHIKQQLLAECNVDRRGEILLERLHEMVELVAPKDSGSPPTEPQFPPNFSEN